MPTTPLQHSLITLLFIFIFRVIPPKKKKSEIPYWVNRIILRKDTWLRAFHPWYYVNRTIYNIIHYFGCRTFVRTPMTATRLCWSQFIAGAYRRSEEKDECKKKQVKAAIADLASFECQVMEFVFTWKKKHSLKKKTSRCYYIGPPRIRI